MAKRPSPKRRGKAVSVPAPPSEEIESESDDFDPSELPNLPPRNGHLDAMQEVASRFKNWRPARQVLLPVRGIPTRFVQFDRITRVGGWPANRFALVHGPSNHGKTTFTLGLGGSHLERGHFFALIDAERTTPITWVEELIGSYADHPGFVVLRPDNYEQAVDQVRQFVDTITEARDKGELPKETTGFIVCDSLRKLVPKRLLDNILKSGTEKGIDGMSGRGAQFKAALNAAWLDELTPLLDKSGCSFAAIARESEGDPDDKSGADYKVGGGKAIYYDSSLVIRIVRAAWIRLNKEDPKSPTYGERHRVEVHKTKVAGKEERTPMAYFHSSNGVLIPAGFDRARDVHEIAVEYGIIDQAGAWFSWNKMRWQGVNQGVKRLTENPDLLRSLESEVRDRFRPDEDFPTFDDTEQTSTQD